MIRPVLRLLHSPDAEPDEFRPDDETVVRFFIQAMVGVAGGGGEDTFNLEVFTPGALYSRIREQGPVTGRHLVIVRRWDFAEVEAFLRHEFESPTAETWDELGARLGRIGRWEFEDYDEARESWQVPPGVGAVVRSMTGLDRAPADPDDFRVPVQVTVGAVKGAGEGMFTVEVCTPRALERRVEAETVILGEHLLIVDHWDTAAIQAALIRMFQSQDGASWPELADRLARYGAI